MVDSWYPYQNERMPSSWVNLDPGLFKDSYHLNVIHIQKNQFQEFGTVMEEYFELGHVEIVPQWDLAKPPHKIFYLPMHTVHKESSTTTKICAVFDASVIC